MFLSRYLTMFAGAMLALFAWSAGPAVAQTETPPPVAAVVDGRLAIGGGLLAVSVSADWSKPLPAIRRAVLVTHGFSRNADDYAHNMTAIAPAGDTLVVAPQFLAPEDAAAHRLPAELLRWDHNAWSGGSPALGPTSLGSFEALDAIVQRLADRQILPELSEIVIAGFSAGGQVLQRYTIVGHAEAAVAGKNIRLRYVIGSPSSFAYFADERPLPDGSFGRFAGAAACPDFNRWKYGFSGNMPAYVAAAVSGGVAPLERRYADRDVTYLVGANDNDPNHRVLDKSCAAEAQGPTRLARAQSFFAGMQRRDGGAFKHRMWVIDGAAHNEARVFGSPCGRAVLFGGDVCPAPQSK